MNLKDFIYDVKDFPNKGVNFKDITPLLNNVEAFQYVIEQISIFVKESKANVVVAPEARGFLLASAVAFNTKTRFVLVRKPGKLPRKVLDIEYTLEYGTNHQQMHVGDIQPGDKVVIIDDILATGGTIEAIIDLVNQQQGQVSGISFLADLTDLHDKSLLSKYRVQKLIEY
ncbi:adenine phosphoribosyltransferase [Williamsoniiplasma somnilux]|uniref:Adenine phosphoribosyltransferase n=1 Tax=Williamsoniiplasma somnilux TaxID=215578 RepID=A0A2K8P198_9MOLU|nr:adenine phosphoribosyltransferase [Williamsoniiplasma somnilux]ATZ18781.1 adenine phosphoribosyltransferase [Williamsoniiplasma somnilux]